MADQVLFGDDQASLRAAQYVLADEDKLGFRDAVERYAEIMTEIGAEVVVPLPSTIERNVLCPHCFETHGVKFDLEVSVPFGEMFPRDEES
jgi:RNase P subunit RPR2